MNIPILRIRFGQNIFPSEIPLFRGAVISSMENADILFHNHEIDSRFRYSYPLIQYKRIGGKAAIICVGEGVNAIGEFFSSGNFTYHIGRKNVPFEVESLKAEKCQVQIWDNQFVYRINNWLPFNQTNYDVFNKMESLSEIYAFLERILVSNILSFAKSMNLYFENEIFCRILEAESPCFQKFKDVKMISFNAVFKTNVSLPLYIGLGKGVSLGHGTISSYKTDINN